MTPAWTIGRLLTWTAGYLRDHGSETPRLDAEVLLAHVCQCPRIALYTAFDQPASDEVRGRFRQLVRRRAEGEPVAYLVGEREFYSLPFLVTPDVLIPRPETEFVIVALMDLAKAHDVKAPCCIADVGTGSGVLAICAARQLPQSRIVAVDTSPQALKIARQNAVRHEVADRIEFVLSDLLTGVDAQLEFDYVLSNPPYVAEHELAALRRDVRQFEPRQALIAGPTGMEVLVRLIAQAAQRIRPGGWLVTEISPRLEAAVEAELAATGQFEPPRVVRDLARLPRVVAARRTRP